MENKPLSSWTLALMIVVIVASLQIMPSCAVHGYSLIPFYLIAAALFFIPCLTLVCELASAHPVTGGSYIWIEKAFGPSWGFFATCIQWISNLIWYPTIFSFIATVAAYLLAPFFGPDLASNKTFMFCAVLFLFWSVTWLNLGGIRLSAKVSALSAIAGVALPIVLLIAFGLVCFSQGFSPAIAFDLQNLNPLLSKSSSWAFLTQIVISLIGVEMALVHAGDVKYPRRSLPRALFYAGCLILAIVIAGPLMIAQAIPPENIRVESGLLDAFASFFSFLGLPFLFILIAALIFIGNWGNATAWMISSTRGMQVACQKCGMPSFLTRTTRKGAPVGILLFEGVLFTLLSILMVSFAQVRDGYWFLLILACQIALLYYGLLFAAALKLRQKTAPSPEAFRVPGGKIGIWIAALLPSSMIALAVFFGFFAPEEAGLSLPKSLYPWMLAGGLCFAFALPFLFLRLAKLNALRQPKHNT